MKSRLPALAALALALPLAFPIAALAAQSSHEHHAAGDEQKLELNAGKKWAIDEPLHKSMTSIRSAIATALPRAHAGKISAADYAALAGELNGQIAHIVQNCKLEPKADAQLHLVLEHMIDGINTLEGKAADKKRAQGVVAVAEALNVYGTYFNHPGWRRIAMPG